MIMKHRLGRSAREEFSKQFGQRCFCSRRARRDKSRYDDKKRLATAGTCFRWRGYRGEQRRSFHFKSIEDHTEEDWDLLYNVLVKGQFIVTQKGVEVMRKQGLEAMC
jgi:hypothetical protein